MTTHPPSKELRHGGTFQLLADCGASRYSEARGVTTKMPTDTETLDTPLPLASNCFVRDCSKPRFMGYYVCAEHFAFYAASRYTESMVTKVEPIGFRCVYSEANCSSASQREHTEPEPVECESALRYPQISV